MAEVTTDIDRPPTFDHDDVVLNDKEIEENIVIETDTGMIRRNHYKSDVISLLSMLIVQRLCFI